MGMELYNYVMAYSVSLKSKFVANNIIIPMLSQGSYIVMTLGRFSKIKLQAFHASYIGYVRSLVEYQGVSTQDLIK